MRCFRSFCRIFIPVASSNSLLSTFLGQFKHERTLDGAKRVEPILLTRQHGRFDIRVDPFL